MWTFPSAGAVKPASRLSGWSGPVKAAPWTTRSSSGTSAAVRAPSRNTVTFSGQVSVSQGLPGPYQSWLPGATNTRARICPKAAASCSPVSRKGLALSNRSPASSTRSMSCPFT